MIIGRTVAHVRGRSTIHVSALVVTRGQTEIGELNKNTTVLVDLSIGDDKVLGLDVAVGDSVGMARGHGVAHLPEHASDEFEPSGTEDKVGAEGGKERRGRGSAVLLGNMGRGTGGEFVFVLFRQRRGRKGVTALFEKVEEIGPAYVFKDKEQTRVTLEGCVERYDVGMNGQTSVDGGFQHLHRQTLGCGERCAGETLDGKGAAIGAPGRGTDGHVGICVGVV
jgi:hypothetical protein